jgi:DNA ligase-associated metallophosphoesterase
LARLAAIIARYAPQTVVALGDSFHDGDGAARMLAPDRDALRALQRGREWIWIAGNHDPDPAIGMGGSFGAVLALGALSFRHEPSGAAGEIAGHLHPVARVSGRGCSITRRCFTSDGMRLLMPAFGAFVGGLNVGEHAVADVFGTLAFTAYVLGEGRIYALPAAMCRGVSPRSPGVAPRLQPPEPASRQPRRSHEMDFGGSCVIRPNPAEK